MRNVLCWHSFLLGLLLILGSTAYAQTSSIDQDLSKLKPAVPGMDKHSLTKLDQEIEKLIQKYQGHPHELERIVKFCKANGRTVVKLDALKALHHSNSLKTILNKNQTEARDINRSFDRVSDEKKVQRSKAARSAPRFNKQFNYENIYTKQVKNNLQTKDLLTKKSISSPGLIHNALCRYVANKEWLIETRRQEDRALLLQKSMVYLADLHFFLYRKNDENLPFEEFETKFHKLSQLSSAILEQLESAYDRLEVENALMVAGTTPDALMSATVMPIPNQSRAGGFSLTTRRPFYENRVNRFPFTSEFNAQLFPHRLTAGRELGAIAREALKHSRQTRHQANQHAWLLLVPRNETLQILGDTLTQVWQVQNLLAYHATLVDWLDTAEKVREICLERREALADTLQQLTPQQMADVAEVREQLEVMHGALNDPPSLWLEAFQEWIGESPQLLIDQTPAAKTLAKMGLDLQRHLQHHRKIWVQLRLRAALEEDVYGSQTGKSTIQKRGAL